MKKLKRLFIFSAAICTLMFFVGCGGDKTSDAMRHFLLETERIGTGGDTIDGNVFVKTFKIVSPFDSSGFIYKKADNSYETDYYNRFMTSPEVLITQQCRDWLARAGIFANVLNVSSMALADYVLEGNIISLYGDFSEEKAAFAVMQIRFFVIEKTQGRSSIIFSKDYAQRIEIQATGPGELVGGYDKCLFNILSDFENDIRDLGL